MTAPTQAPPSTGGEYVCVPVRPTPEMYRAGADAIDARKQSRAQDCYAAMLAKSPEGYVAVNVDLLEAVCAALGHHADVTFQWKGEDENFGDLADELRALLSPAPKESKHDKA